MRRGSAPWLPESPIDTRCVLYRAAILGMARDRDSTRLNVTLAPEHAAKLSRLAEQAYTLEGTLVGAHEGEPAAGPWMASAR